ncbi:LuxR C-terminal-related transcriptional regulator [Sphingopyxis sp.]|uniref:LuxR C-terminal-related transcriptional regulator n=1 Tax=Sphingopyxis sp. TaxID=1908224 RepID=UPI002EDA7F60
MTDRDTLSPGPAHGLPDPSLPYRYAPRPFVGHSVIRKTLLRNLTEATFLKQLSIVRGAAGTGKTTLLGQWRAVSRDMERPVAWLTLDSGDRNIDHFVGGLAAAIEQAGCADIANGFRSAVAEVSTDMPERLSQYLASVCNRADTRLVILLDQYEEADTQANGELLAGFLKHSVSTRLVIASRKRLGFSIAGLLARDQIFEIGPSDLNLTPLETHSLFGEIPELYTRRLHHETSGEPIALGFVRRMMDATPRDVSGADDWHDHLYEYYRSEVLDALPPDMRDAISRLVVVERFDLSLASAIIGRNATALIERLHRSDGILLRHRGAQEFYFPEMLRRFLETCLAWVSEDEHQVLHRRAAAWFDERNRYSEALRHAVEGCDGEHARKLVERVGYANLVLQHGIAGAHQMLEAIGLATEDAPAEQHLSLAVIHAHEGDLAAAAAHLEAAQAGVRDGEAGQAEVADQLLLVEAIVAGLRDDSRNPEMAHALEAFLATGCRSDHESRAQANVYLSWDRFCHGDIAAAEGLARIAAEEYAETEAVYGCIFLHVHRVLNRFWLNDLEQALDEITLAEQITWIFFPGDQRLRAMVAALRAGLLFELGRPDPLTDMTALVGTVAAVEPWTEIQIWTHVQAARAAIAGGCPSEARGIVAYGIEVAKRLESPRLDWALRLADIGISLQLNEQARASEAARALGIANIEELDRLPAFLTWQERIGAALVGAQVAAAQGDTITADRFVARARVMIAGTSAVRFEVQRAIVEARLDHGRGNAEGAAGHFARARNLCTAGLPVRLFLDGGEQMRSWAPDLSAEPADVPLAAYETASHSQPGDDPLTARERQILMLLGEGHQNKVAAHRLGLSEATVKFHLRNIYRKLKAQNRTQALARYRSLGNNRRG